MLKKVNNSNVHSSLGLLAHSRAPITTPPNVVMGLAIGSGAPSPSSPSIQGHEKRDHMRSSTSSPNVAQSGSSSTLGLHHHTSASSSRQAEDPQTAAQRQAAAKLALRKQLEKTLLQVFHLFTVCYVVKLNLHLIYRSRHLSLLHLKCILFPTRIIPSSSTCWAWRQWSID